MSHSWSKTVVFLLAVGLLAGSLAAQKTKPKEAPKAAAPAAPAAAAPAAPQTDFAAILKSLRFREIGPATMGGRIDDFAVVENNPDIIYVGSASGGIFKPVNGGTTWEAIFDNEVTSTIGDITIAPSDPSIVWVGTGEANNRQSSSWGNGVYKSTDAGHTWQYMGLKETHHIGRIVIHPTEPQHRVCGGGGATCGGRTRNAALYKTTDGGKTWNQVLFVNEDTGITDVAMDRESPDTLFAAAYQRRRTVFGFNGSGPASGIYKTTDGGATWKKLEKGLPWDPNRGRQWEVVVAALAAAVGAAVDSAGAAVAAVVRPQQPRQRRHSKRRLNPCPKKRWTRSGASASASIGATPNIVYALIEHANGGIFRSEDKGETWTKMSDTNPRPMYYSQVRIDPNNDLRIWVHGRADVSTRRTAGKTFRQNRGAAHPRRLPRHWIDPGELRPHAGGLRRRHPPDYDRRAHLGLHQHHSAGTVLRNRRWTWPSRTTSAAACRTTTRGADRAPRMYARGIANDDWITVGGGDGFYAQIDPTDPEHRLRRVAGRQRAAAQHEDARVEVHPAAARRKARPAYRFQWNSPIVISASDPENHLLRRQLPVPLA